MEGFETVFLGMETVFLVTFGSRKPDVCPMAKI